MTEPTVTVSIRVEASLLRDYKEVVERDERDVSKDLRLHMKRRVEQARRARAARAAA
jgi:hypothetical protein